MVKPEFTIAETNMLRNLIHEAVMAKGLIVAEAAVHLVKKLDEAEKQSKENE